MIETCRQYYEHKTHTTVRNVENLGNTDTEKHGTRIRQRRKIRTLGYSELQKDMTM